MIFERTPLGQKNRSLFLRVDLVVYVEGGMGKDDDESYDINFWQAVFEILKPSINVKFLPKGGRVNLLRIANDVIENDVQNVLVAIDRDYNELNNTSFSDPRILHSFGYSWENDVWLEQCLVEDVFFSICPRCKNGKVAGDVIQEIQEKTEKFFHNFPPYIIWDRDLVKTGSSLFDRQHLRRYFGNRYGEEPKFKFDDFERLLAQIGLKLSTLKGKATRANVVSRIHLVGHLIESYFFDLLAYLVQKYSLRSDKLTRSGVRSLALTTFRLLLHKGNIDLVNKHYGPMLAKT